MHGRGQQTPLHQDITSSFALDRWACRVVSVVILSLSIATLVMNADRWISDFSAIKPAGKNLMSIFRSDVDGNSPMLGTLLHDYYPSTIKLHFPEAQTDEWAQYYAHFRFRQDSLIEFAYPMTIVVDTYKCFVTKDGIDALKRRAFHSQRANNLTYYLVRERHPSGDMGIYIFNNEFVVAPLARK